MENQSSETTSLPSNLGILSTADYPQNHMVDNYKDIYYQLEQSIGADVEKVNNLVQNNVITNTQGQYLLAQLARKAQQINTYKGNLQHAQNPVLPNCVDNSLSKETPSSMELFNIERPGFFENQGRGDILEYIKGFDMDKDEILKISKLVENLENSAVDRYLKNSAHEKSLNDENQLAKSKLTSYAQNAPIANVLNRIFTRDEIGRMSGEEFNKYEKEIMNQLKQGLIR